MCVALLCLCLSDVVIPGSAAGRQFGFIEDVAIEDEDEKTSRTSSNSKRRTPSTPSVTTAAPKPDSHTDATSAWDRESKTQRENIKAYHQQTQREVERLDSMSMSGEEYARKKAEVSLLVGAFQPLPEDPEGWVQREVFLTVCV